MACVQMLTLSNVRSVTLPGSTLYSLRGVAFGRLGQCLPVLVAVCHRGIWDTGHFYDMAVVSWVCIVGSSREDDLTSPPARTRSSGSAKMVVSIGVRPRRTAIAAPRAFPTPFAALGGTVCLPPSLSVYWWTSGSKCVKQILPPNGRVADMHHFLFFVGLGL